MPFFIWGLALFLYGSIDITILSIMTDDEVVGWYGTAYRFIGIASFFPFALTTALLPNIASLEPPEYRALARRCFDIVFFVSIPVAMFFLVGAQSIIDFLGYPDDYDNSAILIRLLALHVPLVGFTMVGGTLLIALNREGPRTKAAVVAAILSPILNIMAIPYFQSHYDNGAIGSALVTLIVEGFIVVVVFRLLEPGTITRSNYFVAARCLASGAVMGVAMFLALPQGLPALMAVGAVSYLGAALISGAITAREIKDIPRLVLGSRKTRIERVTPVEATP
jgi:O-antigen/teichoic acid export membrane protein